jgi:hypothetical protein
MEHLRSFTAEIGDRICALVRDGAFLKTACSDVGICEKTLRNWKTKGRNGIAPYAKFVEALERAEVQSENVYVASIRRAAEHDWKAAAWLLEHRFNDRWGFRAQVTHSLEEEFKRYLDVTERVLGAEVASRLFAEIADGGYGAEETSRASVRPGSDARH